MHGGVGGELVASIYNLSLSQRLQGAGWTDGGMVPPGSVVAVRGRCRPRALEAAFDWTKQPLIPIKSKTNQSQAPATHIFFGEELLPLF